MDFHDRIIAEVAETACKRICKRAIHDLQSITDAIVSGDESPLENTWDEICVQRQGEDFICWDVYEQTIRATIRYDIESLPDHEAQAIWLQTDQGIDWRYDFDNEDEERAPIVYDEIEDYMLQYILESAESWSNARIREYLKIDL